MLLLWLILAGAAGDDPELALANAREMRHQVAFALTARDEAVFSVTRDFAALSPLAAVALDRQFQLPDDAVVTSFAVRTDGAWRKGRLVPARNSEDGGQPGPAAASPNRPAASLEASSARGIIISLASLWTADPIQVRYTLWARARGVPGGRRWTYCRNGEPGPDQEAAPELSLPPGHPELRVHPDPDDADCLVIEKQEPEPMTATALFGAYPFAPGAWWWRLEATVPPHVAELPSPAPAAPVVVVLDASRSQESRGGLTAQLAIVQAYLANLPGADVELVTTSRTAAPVFGRFVPASSFTQALPPDLLQRPLGNGSFLDRGAALAAEALRRTGRAGRIILMTDGELRSRFDRRAAIAALGRAPAGTVVHLVYPGAGTAAEISHLPPEGLGALPAAFGGASYIVSTARMAGAVRPPDPKTLRPLIRPDALDSLSLVDASRTDWPNLSRDETWTPVDQVPVGETRVWSGISKRAPPDRLELTGWIWSKRVRVPIRRDPGFQRRLARLALSEDALMECHDNRRQRQDAAAQGFAVPGLMFRVAGAGTLEPSGQTAIDDPGCMGGFSGGGRAAVEPKPQDLVSAIGAALDGCAVTPDPGGAIRATVETDQQEILDVTVDGGDPTVRGCLEEGLWAARLPPAFNPGHPRETYRLSFARRAPAP